MIYEMIPEKTFISIDFQSWETNFSFMPVELPVATPSVATKHKIGATGRVIQSAFTLIELLVVIGIIAILLTILLPALKKAMIRGKQIACTGNLKQLGMALAEYANDHDSQLFYPNYDGRWFYYKYIGQYCQKPDNVKADLRGTILWCPGEKERTLYTNTTSDPTGGNFDFISVWWSNYIINISEGGDQLINLKKIKRFSAKIIITDGWNLYFSSGNLYSWGCLYKATNTCIAPRHAGRANYLYLDGHAESIKEFGPNGNPEIVEAADLY